MQHAIERVKRPGESQEALDGKKKDVLESKLDTESPTISRLGKYLMVLMACSKRWRIGTMDVKSAFLQSDYIHHEVEIYGEPSADMRRLLVELIGLREHEIMQMTKPAFGDVRAPRQWNETADKALLTDVGLLKHELDGCIYILRLVMKEDDQFPVFDMNGQSYVVDGLFGLHVDDVPLFASWLSNVHLIFTLISFFIPRSSSFSSHFYAHHPACVCVSSE